MNEFFNKTNSISSKCMTWFNKINWTKLTATIAKINLRLGVILSIAIGIYLLAESDEVLICIPVIILGVILTLITTASVMLFVEISENVAKIREKIEK